MPSKIDQEEIIKELFTAVKEKKTQEDVIHTFRKIGKPAIPYIEKELEQADKNYKLILVKILGRMGPIALSPLKILLRDEESDIRYETVRYLGRMEEAAEPIYQEILKLGYDSVSKVSVKAIWAILRIFQNQPKKILKDVFPKVFTDEVQKIDQLKVILSFVEELKFNIARIKGGENVAAYQEINLKLLENVGKLYTSKDPGLRANIALAFFGHMQIDEAREVIDFEDYPIFLENIGFIEAASIIADLMIDDNNELRETAFGIYKNFFGDFYYPSYLQSFIRKMTNADKDKIRKIVEIFQKFCSDKNIAIADLKEELDLAVKPMERFNYAWVLSKIEESTTYGSDELAQLKIESYDDLAEWQKHEWKVAK
ncbi:MAG: HEAT repeat domain-containing protein [Candidatus Heimdallarchaeota archaeon]